MNPMLPPDKSSRNLRPGMTLVREHAGVLHRVAVMADGFVWNGQTFGSLSAAARAISDAIMGTRYHRYSSSPRLTLEQAIEEAVPGPGMARLERVVVGQDSLDHYHDRRSGRCGQFAESVFCQLVQTFRYAAQRRSAPCKYREVNPTNGRR